MKKYNLANIDYLALLDEMLAPNANALQIAVFLVLLHAKKETADELSGFVSAFKNKMITVSTKHKVLDIVGTGGDGANTVNISTGSAILAASCGIKVAKHGNRAVSSLAGSADVLEALGVNINLSPEKISESIDQIGIGFCFAPNFHPAMQKLRELRRELNLPTIFNLLGILLNPANPGYMLLGVYDKNLLTLIAKTLQKMQITKACVIYGNGLDEITCIGKSIMIEITQTSIKRKIFNPEKLGFSRCKISDLQGGNANTNAKILLELFSGKISDKNQAIADALILNTATAAYLYNLYADINDAILHIKENLYSGLALKLLNNWREFSHD